MTDNPHHRLQICLVLAILLIVPGCASNGVAGSDARARVTDAVSGIAGVVAHTESAQRHVTHAVPHANDTGKVHLAAATDEHKAVLADASEVKRALDATHQAINTLEGQVVAVQRDYTTLESRWFVIWGRRIERALWIIGTTWLALGVASIVFGMGNPLSLTWRIGKEITRLVPMMNPFSWVRDWLLVRRANGNGIGNGHTTGTTPAPGTTLHGKAW